MMTRLGMAAIAAVVLAGCEREAAQVAPVAPAVGRVDSGPAELAAATTPVMDAGAPLIVSAGAQAATPLGVAHDDARAVDHLARARELQEGGDLKGALVECRRALHHDPANRSALELAGRVARLCGDGTLARRVYASLAELAPGDALPMLKLARLAVEEGDARGAIAAADEALLREPQSAEAHHLRGRAWLKLGALSRAIRDFTRATAFDPEHGFAFNNLGYAYLLANEPQKAIEPLVRAAELLPEVPFVQNSLGIAYEKVGLRDEAVEAYGRALALNPRFVKAQVNKARLTQLAQLEKPVGETGDGEEEFGVAAPPADAGDDDGAAPTPELQLAPAEY